MSNANVFERRRYVEKVLPFIGKNLIKVLIGQRRVGKSCILRLIQDEYAKLFPANSSLFIDKELPEFRPIISDEDLIQYVHQNCPNPKESALFIDEVQEILSFETALRGLNAEGYDVYCTGSNADLLSGELATQLSGRSISFPVHGLSYVEFMQFHSLEDSSETLLRYLRHGGLPYLYHLPNDDNVIREYLKSITETVLYKDIVSRHGVRNIPFLERLTEFVADTIGSPLSANSISKFLNSQRINLPTNQVVAYLDHCAKAFLIARLPRHDIEGKRFFEIGEKFYFEDLGIRNALVGYKRSDIGKLLENVVHNHLKICGYSVKTGSLGDKEIDFVASKNDQILYVQVAYLIPDELVEKREFGNLLAIPDNYRKIVVSMDEILFENYKGIEHIHVRNFLMADL